jgi:hypothetical protein
MNRIPDDHIDEFQRRR